MILTINKLQLIASQTNTAFHNSMQSIKKENRMQFQNEPYNLTLKKLLTLLFPKIHLMTILDLAHLIRLVSLLQVPKPELIDFMNKT